MPPRGGEQDRAQLNMAVVIEVWTNSGVGLHTVDCGGNAEPTSRNGSFNSSGVGKPVGDADCVLNDDGDDPLNGRIHCVQAVDRSGVSGRR